MVAGFELDDIPAFIRVFHALFHLVGEVSLLEPCVAPDVKLPVFIHCSHMIITCRKHYQIGISDFIRNIGDIDLIGDFRVSPGEKFTICIDRDTIGSTGSNIPDFAFQRRGNTHHVITRRKVDQ